MKHNRLKQFFQDFYLALILLFLYIPIVTMIVLSFNNTKSRTVWGGFTTHWYTQMFQDSAIMNALNNTLLIAFASALIATVIGTIAAIGINSMKRIPRTIVMGINNIPMLNSDIVTGISLMLAFIAFGISLGFKTVLIAHITFNIPYVILSVETQADEPVHLRSSSGSRRQPAVCFLQGRISGHRPGYPLRLFDGIYDVPR